MKKLRMYVVFLSCLGDNAALKLDSNGFNPIGQLASLFLPLYFLVTLLRGFLVL